jgi:hypothetical protein
MQATLFILCKSETEVEVFDLSEKDKMEKCLKDGYFHTATINPKIFVKHLLIEIPDSEIRARLNSLISGFLPKHFEKILVSNDNINWVKKWFFTKIDDNIIVSDTPNVMTGKNEVFKYFKKYNKINFK